MPVCIIHLNTVVITDIIHLNIIVITYILYFLFYDAWVSCCLSLPLSYTHQCQQCHPCSSKGSNVQVIGPEELPRQDTVH